MESGEWRAEEEAEGGKRSDEVSRVEGREGRGTKFEKKKKTHPFNLLLLKLWPGAGLVARTERLFGKIFHVLLHVGEEESRR